MTNLDTILLLIPALILVVTATWIMVVSAFKPWRGWVLFGLAGLVISAFALWSQDARLWHDAQYLASPSAQAVSGPLFIDAFGHTGRWLAVVLGILFLPMAAFVAREETSGEFLGAALLSFAGLMIVATAADFILLLLGLELISIPTYALLFLGRSDRRGAEATAKYFFLSILSSALFLYGFSFLYGAAGSTHLVAIRSGLQNMPDGVGMTFLPLGIVLMMAGLGFKIAAVPFHFYAPDVYQASGHANAGLLAVLPKAAGVIALVRLTAAIAPVAPEWTWKVAIVMSIASMSLGNVCALWQQDLRRMLAYSSIAHAGYMLIGLASSVAATGTADAHQGYGAMLLYLIVYCGASLGAFATLAYLSNQRNELATFGQLVDLPRRHPVAAGLLAVFMFSLSGIPPLAGFWGKLALFTSALAQTRDGAVGGTWFTVLLIVAALNAAIAAGYYLRVIATMYFGAQAEPHQVRMSDGVSLSPSFTMLACGVMVLAVGLFPRSLMQVASKAGMSAPSAGPAAILVSSDQDGEP